MLFIQFFTHSVALNSRHSANFSVPYLKFEHATVFKTVVMNNVVDVATSIVPDLIPTITFFYPLTLGFWFLPQLIYEGGYYVVSSIYYLGSDLDVYFQSKDFAIEPDANPKKTK
jgi:hypothetical protein